MKKVHNKLMTELSPTKSVDPLTILPRELAEQVLEYLSFRQLINTCRVSKQWAEFIRRTPNLWRHLDLTHARRKVRNAFVSRAINIGRQRLTSATLNNLFDVDKALMALVRYCPLEELHLRNTGLMSADNFVKTLEPLKRLRTLRIDQKAMLDPSLVSMILNNSAESIESVQYELTEVSWMISGLSFPQIEYPRLQRLDFVWSMSWPGFDRLMQNLDKMPNLRRLKLHQSTSGHLRNHMPPVLDFRGLKHLEHLDLLLPIHAAKSLTLPSSLKAFAVGTTLPHVPGFFVDPVRHGGLRWYLPLMEDLKIGVAFVPFHHLEHALNTPGHNKPASIRTLSMARSTVTESLIEQALSHPRLADLEDLSLEACHDVTDRCLEIVTSTLPSLRALNVSRTEVTGAGIKTVVNNGLKKLVANDCRFIGLDAIHWARAQGVQVEHRNTDTMTGGKKVRY